MGLKAIPGFTKRGDTLRVEPCVPAAWPEFSIEYRFGGSLYAVTVHGPGEIRSAGAEVSLDGRVLEGATIPLVDDGARHEVVGRPRVPRRAAHREAAPATPAPARS